VLILVGDFNFLRHHSGRDRFHANDHIPPQAPGRFAGDGGLEHGNVFPGVGRFERDTGILEGTVVREAASDEKGNGVFGPVFSTIKNLFLKFTVAINCVSVGESVTIC
jgi:hypothetical protein